MDVIIGFDLGPRLEATMESLGRRLLAFLIDLWVVGLVFLPLHFSLMFGVTGGTPLAAAALLAVGQVIYRSWMESSRGATVGKQIMNLRVVSGGGEHPTLAQAIERSAWILLAPLAWLLPRPEAGVVLYFACLAVLALSILLDPSGRGLHDRYARTQVESREEPVGSDARS